MADVFFRIPEDSNLWIERPRAKLATAVCQASQLFVWTGGVCGADLFLNCGMVGTIQRAVLVTPTPNPIPPGSDLASLFSLLPGTCLPQTLFPALKAES